jgi:heme/copper-type cytochrome/quinol oxidase subunit 2
VKKWAEEADLKKWAALVIVAALAVTLMLGSVIVLVGASISISRMTNPAMQALATVAELLTGMLWLVGTIYIVTHLAVLIFDKDSSSRS